MNDTFGKIITGATSLAVVAVAVWLGMQFLALKKQEVANEARFQCAQSSRYQVTQKEGTVVWYPVEELYKNCLSEKGVQ